MQPAGKDLSAGCSFYSVSLPCTVPRHCKNTAIAMRKHSNRLAIALQLAHESTATTTREHSYWQAKAVSPVATARHMNCNAAASKAHHR